MLKNGKSLGSDKLEKILRTYPEINTDWLVLGKGKMIKTKCAKNVTLSNGNKKGNILDTKPNAQKMLPIETKSTENATLSNGGKKGGILDTKPNVQKNEVMESDALEEVRRLLGIIEGHTDIMKTQGDLLAILGKLLQGGGLVELISHPVLGPLLRQATDSIVLNQDKRKAAADNAKTQEEQPDSNR